MILASGRVSALGLGCLRASLLSWRSGLLSVC